MQVNIAGLRRAAKNVAHNYTDPQKKVREATSNDPWGPSSTLMSEISDLTYNIEAFAQIMEMLWKRLNDHGKNWRHVYKSLVLIEYLIKTGSERVGQQCKENIFAIQTLKDFQYLEENKDQGMNVREKAKQLVALLTSEEKLRNERARALKARERFAQTVCGFGSNSDSNETTPTSPVFSSAFPPRSDSRGGGVGRGGSGGSGELEEARPQTVGEEELQIQLALAMSKEEAEEEEKRRRSDELRLQMALSQSQQEFKPLSESPPKKEEVKKLGSNNSSALVDLLDVDLSGGLVGAVGGVGISDPWTPPQNNLYTKETTSWANNSPLGASSPVVDPWAPAPQQPINQGWGSGSGVAVDPWAPASKITNDDSDFDMLSRRTAAPLLSSSYNSNLYEAERRNFKKTPSEFLGENSGLVNLDNLVPVPTNTNSGLINPFGGSNPNPSVSLLSSAPLPSNAPNSTINPFSTIIQKPSINEIREKQQASVLQTPSPSSNYQQPQNNNTNLTTNNDNPWAPIKSENNLYFP